jgi:3-methyladenine DNA glycosylase AlkC
MILMNSELTPTESGSTQAIRATLLGGCIPQGIQELRRLNNEIYAAIPAKQRISRGITWVAQRISDLLAEVCQSDAEIKAISLTLHENLEQGDRLQGAPIFLMAEYGARHLQDVLAFFEEVANADDWVVREFAQGAFRKLISLHKATVLPWLQQCAASENPNLRRFAAETLRPVTTNRWLTKEPEYSLSVLRLMFKEAHPYPRTSVGNNLSDLSRRQPEAIFSLAQELVASGDKNSYWIAYRACRNLVKKEPLRVMNILGADEYHYKDRNFYRDT